MVLECGENFSLVSMTRNKVIFSRSDFVVKNPKSGLVDNFFVLSSAHNFYLEKSIYQLFLEFADRSFISGFLPKLSQSMVMYYNMNW